MARGHSQRSQADIPGTFDFICNHIGNEMWMERLQWSGKSGFNAEELEEWKVDGKVAGSYKSYKNLSVSLITAHLGSHRLGKRYNEMRYLTSSCSRCFTPVTCTFRP